MKLEDLISTPFMVNYLERRGFSIKEESVYVITSSYGGNDSGYNKNVFVCYVGDEKKGRLEDVFIKVWQYNQLTK